MNIESEFTMVFRSERQEVSPSPAQVYLELTTHCNLRCRLCARNSIADFRKTHFPLPLLRSLLPQIQDLRPARLVLFGFGEALLHPRIGTIFSLLRAIETKIILVTNAGLLSRETARLLVKLPIDEVYVSWDDDIESGDILIRVGIDSRMFKSNIGALAEERSAAGSNKPILGMEIVATKHNYRSIPSIIASGRSLGIEQFIVTNLYPYSAETADDILYERDRHPAVSLTELLRREIKLGKGSIRIASQTARRNRRCPFIERGTLFITAQGDVAPCPELAYTHSAFYFGSRRTHHRQIYGNCATQPLIEIWNQKKFADFRENFKYYFYPDCSYCYRPDICYSRTVEAVDCYGNETPCGECLWAKDIVICPS